jgi:Tol biopolymer transport system component
VPLLEKLARYTGNPRVSPDGGRVALTIWDGANHDVWVYDAQRTAMTRLTSGGTMFASPVWSHDGRYVIFGSLGRSTFWTRADGSGQPRQLLSTGTFQFPDSVTPDGQRMIFQQVDNRPQLWTVDLRQDESGITPGTPVPFLKTPFADQDARISPDGRWVAYGSNESGKFEVYVRPFSATALGTQGRVQISNSGGGTPRWSPTGGELLYLVGDQIMAVSYTTNGETFVAAKPRQWASGVRGALGMDFAPAGDRVLVNLPSNRDEQAQQRTVVFLQNFLDELRRRAPSRP